MFESSRKSRPLEVRMIDAIGLCISLADIASTIMFA